jgi:hypothetical protein
LLFVPPAKRGRYLFQLRPRGIVPLLMRRLSMKLSSLVLLLGIILLLFFAVSLADLPPSSPGISLTSLTSDFEVAPDTSWPTGSYSYNVSVASDPVQGFLVTWRSEYLAGSTLYVGNYACRISSTGELLDRAAIPLSKPVWEWCVPSAVFAGGNWIVITNKDYLYEWVGAQRITPAGVVLDDPPVNICNSVGQATILYPGLATNGQAVLCVTGIEGDGLYGVIFDPDLNILVDRFLILSGYHATTPYRVAANGDNFVIAFYNWGSGSDSNVKLVIVDPEGQVLSTQTVNGAWGIQNRGTPTISTFESTNFVTYFESPTLWGRRYAADGNPVDAGPVSIINSPDFDPVLEQLSYGVQSCAYTDLIQVGQYFFLFWPRTPEGISAMGFQTDLSARLEPLVLDSQAQCKLRYDPYGYSMSNSIIRAAAIGNKVLTVWIDGRGGDGRVYGNLLEAGLRKDDLLGTWSGQGVYYRNSDTAAWVKLASPATKITVGDLDGDEIDDLIGLWPGQGGIWVKSSQSGTWVRLSSTAQYITAGDMNGDDRVDLLGTWDGQGVFYRDSITGTWVKMASPATMVTAGDIDNDGTDDLIGLWPSQGGIWVKYSQTGTWAKLSSTAVHIAAGDMNGDKRDDLLGTWDGQGAFYRDSATGTWVKMASPATLITTGDIDGDGTDDLIGIWPTQGGVWVKYSSDGTWERLSSTAQDIAAGKMRAAGGSASGSAEAVAQQTVEELPLPMGGSEEGPAIALSLRDLSDRGPGGARFVCLEDINLEPKEDGSARLIRVPGPGESGVRWIEQENLFPRETPKKEKKASIDQRTGRKK